MLLDIDRGTTGLGADRPREEEVMRGLIGAVLVASIAVAAAAVAAEDIGMLDVTPAQLEAMGLDQTALQAPDAAIPADTSTPAAKAGNRALVPAALVVRVGDTPPGAPGAVTALNSPFTNGDGEVGFTGSAGDNFVWFDTGITWLNGDALPGTTLTGGEGTMGVGDNGEFIYSPAVNGDDGVWTHNGLLLVEGTPAPGYPAPANTIFNSRPHMLPGGASYWVAGISYSGGTTTEGRVLYTSSDSTPATITPVIASDDLVGGLPIDRPSGVGFSYQISDNATHHIHSLLLDTGGTTDDGIVYVDGAIVARELSPSGGGDNWDNFDNVTINNAGDYLFSGDTDGSTASDEFIAFNGAIAIREGDTLGGVPLTSTASVNALSMNNLGRAAFIWNVSGIGEVLFYACDASDLAGSTVEVLRTNDELDLDAVPGPEAVVTDFNASFSIGPGLWLAEDGRIFVELDLNFGAADLEAIVALDAPSCGAGHLVVNEIDYDQIGTDAAEFLEIYNGTGATVNLNGYQVELVNGTGGGASVYLTIPLPSVDLANDDYFVVCANVATTFNCDLDVSPDTNLIQNGAPDAVALRDPTGALVDTVSYEGDTGAPYTEGSGVGLEDDPTIDYYGISRYPNGVDTDVNNLDLGGYCHSPGLPNLDTTGSCEPVPVELMRFSVE
jgi:hypothetical protein